MQRWVERSEARWALWSGVAGAFATAALSTKMILSHGSSTAGLGFIFLPLVAGAAAVPIGIWGAALGHVVAHLRGRAPEPKIVFWAAVVAAASLPVTVCYEIWNGLALERAVAETRPMSSAALEHVAADSPWRRNKYFLGALAENRAASPLLLERMASLEDPALYESMWSLWDVMGENRKGLAVMRLVARHRNAPAAALERLEAHPQAQEMITEILANPNAPRALLAKHYEDTHYRAEWGLAMNPKTPPAVMERLARSENRHARTNLVLYNPVTPRDILEQLARDPDPFTAQKAAERLERPRMDAVVPNR
jgi:hypothetical protein